MASLAICLDQNQNTINCMDPDCTYGDCGSTPQLQQSTGSLCLDANQNQVPCGDPSCTYGDCLSSPTGSVGHASVSTENGASALSVPSAGGATNGISTSALLTSFANLGTAITNKVNNQPVYPYGTYGTSGFSTLFANPIFLIILVVLAFFAFGGMKKST
jgi:hypothetical protein